MTLTAEEWAHDFGDDYTDRNMSLEGRGEFWNKLVRDYDIRSALEVGCNTGINLQDLSIPCTGVDVNPKALSLVPQRIRTFRADATELPFKDDSFDLVLTFGVLIHIPPDELDQAMSEIIRVSRRFVFAGEYAGDEEIPYRGEVLWRRNYGKLYEDKGMVLLEDGVLKGEPWDRGEVHWWLLEQ